MNHLKSPQAWKTSKIKKRKLKSYRPLIEKPKKFTTRRIGRPKGIRKIFKPLIKLALVLIIFGIIALGGAFFWYSRELPTSTDLLTKNPVPSTKIYDRTGKVLLNDINANFRRVKIKLNELPEYVKWSTIVTEDKQFYSHHGINFRGILRAILVNILRGNATAQGGSSISQQFVKNALLSPKKTYTRKLKEIILTWQLERKFTKDEILEMYFNEIPYGGTAYGIEAAANKYFNKSAKDLTLAEAAALAALPKAPSYYSPYGPHKDKLLARKNWILDSLAKEGYVPRAKIEAAKRQKLKFANVSSAIIAPHFVFYVRDLVAKKYGEKMLNEGSLKIITTLDVNQQKIAEEVIKDRIEKNIKKYNAHNAALVAMNVKTGEITAMVGSANYFDEKNDGAVNVALQPRQPGSSFKPIVYSVAFSKGYSPKTILFDVLTKFKTSPKDYEPHNYNDKYFGPVSMKKALAGSLNVPAVKTIYLVGVKNVLDLAEKMGYTTFKDRSRFGLSLVLGGGEVKLLEHVNGFATLADDGEYKKPMAILKIEDRNGKVLEENNPKKNKKKEVISKQIARQITDILSDNQERAFIFGKQNYLNLGKRPVAAKTGTTNDYKDAWTLGYTPSLVCGVWTGNTRGELMKGAAAGANVAAPIWHEFMKRVFEETKPEDSGFGDEEPGWKIEEFKKPKEEDLPQKPMLNGKIADEIKVKIDKTTGKLATDLTPKSQIEEKVFREVHNILHYVNKNNPLGPIPAKPWELDENYNNWEMAVEKWAKENGYETKINLPNEYDNLHTEANRPSISIDSPADNSNFNSPEINVTVSASAPRGVRRVEYYLDSQKLASINNPPFNLENFKLIGFSNGSHILKAVAYDDIDNSRSAQIKINLNLPAKFAQPVIILKPENGEEIYEEYFPYPIKVQVNNYEYYNKIDFYLKDIDSNSSKWIGYKNIDRSDTVFIWTDPQKAGSYLLYAIVTDKYGKTKKSGEVKITIK